MNLYGNFNNENMSEKDKTLDTNITYIVHIDEILESADIKFLMDCKDAYEQVENYEFCAKIRDRLKQLNDIEHDNSNNNI